MKAHEIFANMSPELATRIFTFLQTEEKPMYKTAIQGLANQRNLRAVFVERKAPNERFAWMKSALARKLGDTLAAHLLQAWLLGAHKQMLCDFLDSLGIAHDEDGTVENLPPEMSTERLTAAASQLLEKYPREEVAVYLHAFRDMDASVSWPALGEMLDADPRLNLPQAQADSAAA